MLAGARAKPNSLILIKVGKFLYKWTENHPARTRLYQTGISKAQNFLFARKLLLNLRIFQIVSSVIGNV